MNDLFVERRADRCGKAVQSLECRDGPQRADLPLGEGDQLPGCDSRPDRVLQDRLRLRRDATGLTHVVQLSRGLDRDAVRSRHSHCCRLYDDYTSI